MRSFPWKLLQVACLFAAPHFDAGMSFQLPNSPFKRSRLGPPVQKLVLYKGRGMLPFRFLVRAKQVSDYLARGSHGHWATLKVEQCQGELTWVCTEWGCTCLLWEALRAYEGLSWSHTCVCTLSGGQQQGKGPHTGGGGSNFFPKGFLQKKRYQVLYRRSIAGYYSRGT
eukprot:scaffold108429_cov18-Tisochrysis_lutea.AAC.1